MREMQMNNEHRKGHICLLAGVVTAFFGAEPALADMTCEPLDTAIPELETAKATLAAGDYPEFFQWVRGLAADESEADAFARTIGDAFPDGFVSCSTILQDMRSERFVEDISVFESSDGRLFFLYWAVMMHAGEWVVLEYRVSTEFSEISSTWK